MGEEVRQKYGNKKVGKYSSKKEANYATYLHGIQKAGNITELKEQVKFQLIPAQYIDGKCVERAWSYVADFSYVNSEGQYRVIDVKGFRTPEYIAKRKAMLFLLCIRVEEV